MNWTNVNLNSTYEASQSILDAYSFDTLLLEIECNLPVINADTVKAQAMLSIKQAYDSAIEVLNNNLQNITNHALKTRAVK